MNFQCRLKHEYNLIDLTPLVDVIFLMLIFFLITSDILPMKSLLLDSPKVQKEAPTRLCQLLVVMDKDQVIYVGSKRDIVDLHSVGQHLKGLIEQARVKYPDYLPTVVLSCDKHVDYEAFLNLFSQIQECVPRVRLAFCSPTSDSDPSQFLKNQ